jgi:DnaA family protein
MRQMLLDLLPESPPTLENFLPGGNHETFRALADWLARPLGWETAFFLWGASGSGKSHLLRASGLAYRDARENPALDDVAEEETRLAVDHVDCLDESGQVALFHLFNRVRGWGGRLLCASFVPPARLVLREDLRTRLGSGLIYRLHPLADEEKKAALVRFVAARSLSLADGILDYLLRRVSRDMRSLAAILEALDRYSLEQKRPLTLPLLRAMLAEKASSEP